MTQLKQGVICINKPEGMTSHDVVSAVRRRIGIKKVGHTGTLDPMATGVLPVAIGKATRMIEYYDADMKTYRASMKLGVVTDTLDVTGTVTGGSDWSAVTEEMIREASARYVGDIMQVPPKYSALKVNGKRAYELARRGVDVEIKARPAYIDDIYEIEYDPATGVSSFTVCCAKGTYIRSLCDDIGRDLGCGAAMSALCRTASGYFSLGNSVTIDELKEMSDEEIGARVIPVWVTLLNLGSIVLDDEAKTQDFAHGRIINDTGYRVSEESYTTEMKRAGGAKSYKVFASGGEFCGIGHVDDDGVLHADKVLV